MCKKNMEKWKKKWKFKELATWKFIEDYIAWIVAKIQKVKIQKLQGQKTKALCFIKMCIVWQ